MFLLLSESCCSVAESCLTLWPPRQKHTRLLCPALSPRVCSDSCPLRQWYHPIISSSATPFSFGFSLSQHQGLFQWVDSSHDVAKVLALQHQSFQWIDSWFPLELTGLISLQSKGLSRIFSSTTIQNHESFGAQPSLWSSSHICTWLLEKPYGPLSAKGWICFFCTVWVCHSFPSKKQASSNFMAAVTVCMAWYCYCYC